ncbi:hypothetical protein WS93_07555 [Burkholderia cepacia]|nr:hypothetical protein WS93_07555 [Burkholderia cepacia]
MAGVRDRDRHAYSEPIGFIDPSGTAAGTLHLSRQIASASKVIIVAGASQGIGAETVNAFRARGHRVVATSRSIGPSNDPDLVTVAGDNGDPA